MQDTPPLTAAQEQLLGRLVERNERDHGDDLLGLVLSGSAGRGRTTRWSDLDVFVVLSDDAAEGLEVSKSAEVDEMPISWSELDELPEFGSQWWFSRWAFAWAPVLLDRTGGELAERVRRQALVDGDEAERILLDHDRLDGWVNFAFRALKSDRAGRPLECRLDAVESLPWLLDTIWTLAGRVRPYHSYLPWELRTHPLPDWDTSLLLELIQRTADGDPSALRETLPLVRAGCERWQATRGHTRATDTIDGWGDQLALFDA